MLFPIQAAPIDRANRALHVSGKSSQGLSTQAFDIGKLCPICDFLPPPVSGVCKLLCPVLGDIIR